MTAEEFIDAYSQPGALLGAEVNHVLRQMPAAVLDTLQRGSSYGWPPQDVKLFTLQWNEWVSRRVTAAGLEGSFNELPNLGRRPTWAQTFLDLAVVLSHRGTCPRLQAGAVVASAENRIIGTGYNGAPRGSKHCTEAGCMIHDSHCVRAIHAEQNALLEAVADTGGVQDGMKLYSTHRPCIVCARMVLQYPFAEVHYLYSYDSDGMLGRVETLFQEKGVHLAKYS